MRYGPDVTPIAGAIRLWTPSVVKIRSKVIAHARILDSFVEVNFGSLLERVSGHVVSTIVDFQLSP